MRAMFRVWFLAGLFVAFSLPSRAVTPTDEEKGAMRRWAEAAFSATPIGQAATLEVRHQDVAEAITRGRSWRGSPFQIGERSYSHGIAFNSVKHLVVRTGRPAKRFQAEVGLENNDDTRRGEAMGQGSVTFQVLVDGKEVFASPVLRRKDAAIPVDVSLDGAQQFEIRVGDAGDGRGWDQALWGAARVILQDDTVVRLQDVPMQGAEQGLLPFSFVRGGAPSVAFAAGLQRSMDSQAADSRGVRRTVTFLDRTNALEIRVEAILFDDFPAVEWVVHFTNRGDKESPLLEQIMALDSVLPVPVSGPVTLHWSKGGVASFDDFAPESVSLRPGGRHALSAGEGRSSSQVLPFFNLEGAGAGVIAAIGWSGTWQMEVAHTSQGQVTLRAGMEHTHLVLHPGESIRTPRMLLLQYQGDRWRGQNLLRRFLLRHHRPAPRGQPMVAPITCGNWGGTRAEVHLDNIRVIERERLPIAYYWIDAEWYGRGGWPVNVGDWRLKEDLYPGGFAPLSQALRPNGRELMLWFEPERVYKGTPWHQQHRAWLLDTGGANFLWNLGNPEARRFLTEFISARVEEYGLGCYRQDFNIDPAPFWKAADAPDRQGIAEIRYIEGLYAFWDGLLERHPGLIIDNCASGGRRIDLETIGRATPFWRTDGPRDPIAHQCHTFGLLAWVPLSATSQDRPGDDYEFRSSMCSALCLNWWVSGDVPAEKIRADFPFAWARTTLESYLEFRPNYYGDYYPLSSYTKAADAWMAYQLDRPEEGQGMIVVLRRPESPYESARFPLRGLDPHASYRVSDLDGRIETGTYTGRQLLQQGVPIRIDNRPGSAVILYKRI